MKKILILGLIIGLGCGKQEEKADEPAQEEVDAPATPPPGSLAIDLSVKEDGENLEDGSSDQSSAELLGLKHTASMIIVGLVNLNVAAALAVPVGLLRKAAQSDPKQLSSDTYVWSFDFSANGKEYTGNFTGTKSSVEGVVSWSMQVDTDELDGNGCCDEFIFYDGETSTSQQGYWQIYNPIDPDAEDNKLFRIDYNVSDDSTKTLQFTVNSNRSPDLTFGAGSTIEYLATPESIELNIRDSKGGGTEHAFQWNRDTKEGSYDPPSGNTLCWGPESENFPDEECPN